MARVMDLQGWPPQSAGAHTVGDSFPITVDEVTVESVERVFETCVMFTCRFLGRSVRYHFFVPDRKTADRVSQILIENTGKPLLAIGTVDLSPNPGKLDGD